MHTWQGIVLTDVVITGFPCVGAFDYGMMQFINKKYFMKAKKKVITVLTILGIFGGAFWLADFKLRPIKIYNKTVGSINYYSTQLFGARSGNGWSNIVMDAQFSPRDGQGFVEFKDRLWILGGWTGECCSNEVWSSINGKDWVLETGSAPWRGRHGAGWVAFKDKLWVIGGDEFEDVWSSEDGKVWNLETQKAPWGRRYTPYVVVHDQKIWLMGGNTWIGRRADSDCAIDDCVAKGYNDIWASDNGKDWIQVLEHAPWVPRGFVHGSAVLNGRIWVIGGGIKGRLPGTNGAVTLAEYRDVWSSTDGKTWRLETGNVPWRGRTHFSVAAHNGMLFVSDGSIGTQYPSGLSNKVWCSIDGREWKQLPATPMPPRHASGMVSYKGYLYLAAGKLWNDVWRYEGTPPCILPR
jgi:hypothetical protein